MNEYTTQILDYSQNPPNYGVINNSDYTLKAQNPSCGDDLTVYINIQNGIITQAKFIAEGCAISKAATSMLLEDIIGKKLSLLKNTTQKDMLNLLEIEISKTREKCAFLVLDALQSLPK